MAITDILVYQTQNGGDLEIRDNDFVTINGIENTPFLALFGNKTSFWGNEFLGEKQQFRSKTERVLSDVVLNSEGRLLIEQAVKEDLSDVENAKVSVKIVGANRVQIDITIDGRIYRLLWHPDIFIYPN